MKHALDCGLHCGLAECDCVSRAAFDRVWFHAGKGHWIGSLYMCFAASEAEATAMIRKAMDEDGLASEPINLQWRRADVPGVFHRDNGDY